MGHRLSRAGAVLCLAMLLIGNPVPSSAATQSATPLSVEARVFLPIVRKPFAAIPGASYETLCMSCVSGWAPTDREPSRHPDLNMAMRGWAETNADLGLVDIAGGTHKTPPQLYGLFVGDRVPSFSRVYRVYDWNWANMERGELISAWDVTLLGAATTTGEIIQAPPRWGQAVGVKDGVSFIAMVLYATDSSITLKYTREDNVVEGYTIHLDGLAVDPALVSLYQRCHAEGRHALPALRERQPFARAAGSELRVAIRDCGAFMDPRSRKDWWIGY